MADNVWAIALGSSIGSVVLSVLGNYVFKWTEAFRARLSIQVQQRIKRRDDADVNMVQALIGQPQRQMLALDHCAHVRYRSVVSFLLVVACLLATVSVQLVLMLSPEEHYGARWFGILFMVIGSLALIQAQYLRSKVSKLQGIVMAAVEFGISPSSVSPSPAPAPSSTGPGPLPSRPGPLPPGP